MSELRSHLHCLIIAVLGIAIVCPASGQEKETGGEVIRVEDLGAVADDGQEDGAAIRQAIARAIASDKPATVLFGTGRYHVSVGRGRTCFPIRGARNLVIEGQGDKTELIVTDPRVGAFAAMLCDGLTFKRFSIDYDPLPFTQGVIVAVDLENGSFDLDIDPEFPLLSEPWFTEASDEHGKWGMIFDSRQPRLKSSAADHVRLATWTHVANRVWRIRPQSHMKHCLRDMGVGDRFVHLARGVGGVGVALRACRNCSIEDVTIYAGPSTATVLVANETVRVRGLTVCRRPGSKRLLSTDADGVHCQQNRAGPIIEDCSFSGMADDSINIYAPPNVVLEVLSPTELLVTAQCAIRPGDTVQVMNPRSGTIRDEVKVVAVGADQRRRLRITLERAVAGIQAGTDHTNADTLYNLSACGAGYIIRNNHMAAHRRHGMLLRAGHGLVEGNHIHGVAGLGIVVTNEPDWPEGPYADDITIRNNTIEGVGYAKGYGSSRHGAAIQIKGTKLRHGLAEGRVQRNILIENNRIVDPPGAGVFIGAAQSVQLNGNRVETSPATSPHRRTSAILLMNSSAVTVDGLTVTDPQGLFTAAVEIDPSVAAGEGGVAISDVKATSNGDAPHILDRR
ncbi:MAG: right-handed parallel beta-helix repeat-containing protein [Planctomycetes bacterium]|nr:right-handed parallel beta-helix repeat-containing protein [Planctomycetota bacterium]MBL7040192.1 right-handed parallel beta-helix repeat-containing protein [Pirellulaceae bacterium]